MRKVTFLLLVLFWGCSFAGAANEKFTLVIDAGHGGKDHGAPGTFSEEKTLTLKMALAFGKLVEANCPDVRVIYTRKTDVFIPLYERAEIANSAKADLFISIHINALDGGRKARGFQSYTLGRGATSGEAALRQNVEVARRENAVIFMEKDYKTLYKGLGLNSAESDIMFEIIADNNRQRSVALSSIMQQEVCAATGRANGGAHQANLAVCRLTSMPAVLLELGFISTLDEEQYMNSDAAAEAYPRGIFNAFLRYKNKYDTRIRPPYREDETPQLLPPPVQAAAAGSKADNNVEQSEVKGAKENNANKEKKEGQTTPRKGKEEAKTSSKRVTTGDSPVFKVQIFTSSQRLKSSHPHFQGQPDVDLYEENGTCKYTCGASSDYNEIYRLRKQLLEKFPQAFIIAFNADGQRMDINEAIRLFKRNRK